MRQTSWCVAVVAGLLPLTASAVRAHHSFAAEYDANQPITLQGQIARIDLVNPHAWLYLEVKDADGKVVRWNVEMGAPNNLIRRGVTKATLQIRLFGAPISTFHRTTLPSASFTSRYSHACGLTRSMRAICPCSVIGWFASYSAANE